jgi:tRNA-(ms[2]io[6]A)-hydroxylase
MVAAGADDAAIRAFYLDLARSEARHHALYHRLAKEYFPSDVVQARLDELLDAEAAIVRQLPHRAALH